MNKLLILKELLLDIFFPKFCINCNKEGKYICDECDLFSSDSILTCPICGKNSFFGETHYNCKKIDGLDGLISFWDYDGIIKMAIEKAKNNGFFDILNELSKKAFLKISKDNQERFNLFLSFILKEDFAISYVPIERKKEKELGFNHAKVIADNFAKILNKKSLITLKKERVSQKQSFFRKKEDRINNVKDSFVLNGEIYYKRLILVDDLFSSGSTMKECCKILKKGGVKEVWGLALSKDR